VEWDSVKEMERDVRELVDNGLRVCFGSCCHELQTQEQHRQHALIQKLKKYHQQAIEVQNEEQANAAFINLNIAAALLHHLQLWLLLKADCPEEAWNQLVESLDSFRVAGLFAVRPEICPGRRTPSLVRGTLGG